MIPVIHIKNIKDAKDIKRETKPQINYLKMHSGTDTETETRKMYKSTKPPVTKDTKDTKDTAMNKEQETVKGWKHRQEQIHKKQARVHMRRSIEIAHKAEHNHLARKRRLSMQKKDK